MDLLIPESGLFIWMLVAFAVVFFVLAKFGWPAITGMIDERAKYIDESVAKAKEAADRLARINDEADNILKQAKEQQAQILAEAVSLRTKIVDEAKAEATVAGQKVIEEAREQIRTEREDAIRDIRRQVGLLSVQISEKVLRQSLKSEASQMAMIDRMLDELEAEQQQ